MEAKPPSGLLVATATIVVLSGLAYAIVGGFALTNTVAGKPESEKIGSSRHEAEKVAAARRMVIAPTEPSAIVVPAVAVFEASPPPAVVLNRPNDPVSPARRDQIRAAQIALARLGFYNGQIDGSMGKGTIGAIRAFEKSLGLPETGQLTANVAARLSPQRAANQ
jgi:hypothetical protein